MRAGKKGRPYRCLKNGETTYELLKIFFSERQRRTSWSPIRTNPFFVRAGLRGSPARTTTEGSLRLKSKGISSTLSYLAIA